MRIPINKIAHGIGMQNQYLGYAVQEGKVIGDLAKGGDYHSDQSWVDVESVRQYLKWKLDNWVISKEQYDKYIQYIDENFV